MKHFLAIIFCLIALLLSSCSEPAEKKFTTMTAEEVYNFIVISNNLKYAEGTGKVVARNYAIPSVEWIEKEFTPYFKNYLFKRNLLIPTEESNDCDKFVIHAMSQAFTLFHNTKGIPEDTALAIGFYTYYPSIDAHAINFFIATRNGELVLIFYEPQMQSIIELNPEEEFSYFWFM